MPLPPLPPSEDTFTTLLKWGRPIVNQHYPNESKQADCITTLIDTAEQRLPDTSKTRHNKNILTGKATQVVKYLWKNTDPHIKLRASTEKEDERRFKPHAEYIQDHRQYLLDRVSGRDQEAAGRILDLLLRHHGRVAAVELYHNKGTNPICGHYRQWRRIRQALDLVALVDYEKPHQGRGTCRQYGLAAAHYTVQGRCGEHTRVDMKG